MVKFKWKGYSLQGKGMEYFGRFRRKLEKWKEKEEKNFIYLENVKKILGDLNEVDNMQINVLNRELFEMIGEQG